MSLFDITDSNNSRKVFVIPRLVNSPNIEDNPYFDFLHNQITALNKLGNYYWNILLPKPSGRLNQANVKQHIAPIPEDLEALLLFAPWELKKLLSKVDYEVIYSHLPEWPQIGRYRKTVETKIIGFFPQLTIQAASELDEKEEIQIDEIMFKRVEGIFQMETCYINSQDQKIQILEEAGKIYNNRKMKLLDNILRIWDSGLSAKEEDILFAELHNKLNSVKS